jgi:hypothetical protein
VFAAQGLPSVLDGVLAFVAQSRVARRIGCPVEERGLSLAGCHGFAAGCHHGSMLNFLSSVRIDRSSRCPALYLSVHCETFTRNPRHALRTNGNHSTAAALLEYALPDLIHPCAGCRTIVK